MNIIEPYKLYWKNMFKMQGRSRRKDYWLAILFSFVITLGIRGLAEFLNIIFGYSSDELTWRASDTIDILWGLVNVIPSFTLLARRLQDININGWWSLIPHFGGILIIIIILIVFFFIGGLEGLADNSSLTIFLGVIIIGISLSILIHLIFFILTLLDSNPRPNKFGDDPKKNERYYTTQY